LEDEWKENTKQDYYLAQIAAEIRLVREMFASNPKQVSIKDCLLPFSKELNVESESTNPSPKVEVKTMRRDLHKEKPKRVKISKKLAKDPKWAKVDANAKQIWAARMGFASFDDLAKG
jgi:hypothetical protein